MMSRLAPMIARFKAELVADKKRATVLGVLLLVLCIAVGNLVFGDASPGAVVAQPAVAVPPIATAAVDVTGAAPRVRPTIESASSPPPVPAPVELTVAQTSMPEVAANPIKPVEIEWESKLKRDLFTSAAWSSFPLVPPTSSSQPGDVEELEGGFWGKLATSLADLVVEHRIKLQVIEKLAQKLRVQATMSGTNPTAYISGRLVHVGDTIKSFSVVAIEERSVTVALDGHHVTLRIP